MSDYTELSDGPPKKRGPGRPPKFRPQEYDISTDRNSRVEFLQSVLEKLRAVARIQPAIMDSDTVIMRKAQDVQTAIADLIISVEIELAD